MSLLLEVIFGLGLFAVALLLLFGIFPTSHRAVTQAKNISLATTLARELLEGEMSKGYDLAASQLLTTLPRRCIVNGVTVDTDFDCLITVDPHPTQPNVKVIESRVTWTEGGIQREVRLHSYVGDF